MRNMCANATSECLRFYSCIYTKEDGSKAMNRGKLEIFKKNRRGTNP